MRLNSHPELIEELEILIANDTLDINSTEIINSKFYQMMQNETILEISPLLSENGFSFSRGPLFLSSKIIMLAAKIAVAAAPSINTVKVWGNNLGLDILELFEILNPLSSSLHTLDISGNNFGREGPTIMKALAPFNSIKTFSIRDNKLGANAPETMNIISTFFPSLDSLDIASNNLGSEAPATMKVISTFFPSLHSLDISNNKLGSDAPATVKSLKPLPLHTLKLWGNSLGADSQNTVKACITNLTSLTNLDIEYNDIGEYARETAMEATRSISLKTLNMISFGISATDIAYIKTDYKIYNDQVEIDNCHIINGVLKLFHNEIVMKNEALEIMGHCENFIELII